MKINPLLFLLTSLFSFSQADAELNNFLDDATYYADKYISPATNAVVYFSSSNWVISPKKQPLYSINFAVHGNVFIVPNQDRSFLIKNSDFKFFKIYDKAYNPLNEAVVPTVFGSDEQFNLIGSLGGSSLRVKSPEGVNNETVVYPFMNASIGLWKGFEISAKYSPKFSNSEIKYEFYGFGLKHNFSQYFKKIEAKNIYFSGLIAFSKEEIISNFIETDTPFGTLGINKLKSNVDTWQFQISASKEWKKFELMLSSITNTSDLEYKLTGERGTIENFIPVQSILNKRLESIYTTKVNTIFEISGRYKLTNLSFQSSITFGKFLIAGASVNYQFNAKHQKDQ